ETDTGSMGVGLLPERDEDARQIVRRYTGTRVAYDEFHTPVGRPRRDVDLSSLGRELDRVAAEVGEHLQQTLAVRRQLRQFGLDVGDQDDVALCGEWCEELHCIRDDELRCYRGRVHA